MQVPYGPKPEAKPRPPVDPIYLAMAASDLDEAGLLYQPDPVPSEAPPDAPPSL